MKWERKYKSFDVTRSRPYNFGAARSRGFLYHVGVRQFGSWREAKAWIDEFWNKTRQHDKTEGEAC